MFTLKYPLCGDVKTMDFISESSAIQFKKALIDSGIKETDIQFVTTDPVVKATATPVADTKPVEEPKEYKITIIGKDGKAYMKSFPNRDKFIETFGHYAKTGVPCRAEGPGKDGKPAVVTKNGFDEIVSAKSKKSVVTTPEQPIATDEPVVENPVHSNGCKYRVRYTLVKDDGSTIPNGVTKWIYDEIAANKELEQKQADPKYRDPKLEKVETTKKIETTKAEKPKNGNATKEKNETTERHIVTVAFKTYDYVVEGPVKLGQYVEVVSGGEVIKLKVIDLDPPKKDGINYKKVERVCN